MQWGSGWKQGRGVASGSEGVLEGLPRRRLGASAIMSAGPYLHSIAFSMQVHLASGDFAQSTKSSESIVRLPNPLLKPNESSDPFY